LRDYSTIFPTQRCSNSLALHHFLIDPSEDRVVLGVEHFDLDAVAGFQEWRCGFAGLDRLNHALL
jgi:hypothetical protein